MTDAELTNLLKTGKKIPVPYFDGQEIAVDVDMDFDEALPALKRFLTLSAESRRADSRHLIAYCRFFDRAVQGGVLDDMGGAIPTDDKIWNHATIRYIILQQKAYESSEEERNKVYVTASGAADWEPEHGLAMNWENGDQLVRVGPSDGSLTNYYRSGKKPEQEHVFHCYIPSFCTLRDPK